MLRLVARARLRADQHRPDRRHGRRDLGQLAASACRKTIELAPDSVTIYQMELPYNTVFSQGADARQQIEPPASPTGRPSGPGCDYAFDELAKAGLRRLQRLHDGEADTAQTSSSSTATRCGTGPTCSAPAWRRSAHVNGVHVQNVARGASTWGRSPRGDCRLGAGFADSDRERLIREMILQLKPGHLEAAYFREKFGVDIRDEFAPGVAAAEEEEMLRVGEGAVGPHPRRAPPGGPAAPFLLR